MHLVKNEIISDQQKNKSKAAAVHATNATDSKFKVGDPCVITIGDQI